jgi:hypothetical protein
MVIEMTVRLGEFLRDPQGWQQTCILKGGHVMSYLRLCVYAAASKYNYRISDECLSEPGKCPIRIGAHCLCVHFRGS